MVCPMSKYNNWPLTLAIQLWKIFQMTTTILLIFKIYSQVCVTNSSQVAVNCIIYLFRGGPLQIPRGGGGYNFCGTIFFSVSCLCKIFFYAFNLWNNFFQDYLHFVVSLHAFFFSDVMAARICLQAFFFERIIFLEFSPPPPSRDF
jgi:hypothetical protein